MAGRALEDLRPDAGVGAGVADDPGPDGDEAALGVAADLVVQGHRRGAWGGAAGSRAARGRAGPGGRSTLREQRRLPLDGEVLLAAERAAGRDLGDPDVRLREAQERGDLAAVLPGALALREEVERTGAPGWAPRRPWPARPGHAPARGPRPGTARQASGSRKACSIALVREAFADDVGGGRQRGRDVAAPDDRGLEEVAARVDGRRVGRQGRERVGDGLEHLVLDLDERGGRPGLRRACPAATAARTSPT